MGVSKEEHEWRCRASSWVEINFPDINEMKITVIDFGELDLLMVLRSSWSSSLKHLTQYSEPESPYLTSSVNRQVQ